MDTEQAGTERGPGVERPAHIAIVDDDPDFRGLLSERVSSFGYLPVAYECGEALLDDLSMHLFSAVLLDISMPGLGGYETLRAIHDRSPHLPTVMITADEQVESVVTFMRAGAYDYVLKPAPAEKLHAVLRNAVEKHQLTLQVIQLTREAGGNGYEGIAGDSLAVRRVFRMMDRIAPTEINVLIHGESGTGKELVANAIHRRSSRANGPFVALNSAAIPETLLEAELFGHEKGAFTGAISRRAGKIEEADGGTLFLDEIGEVPLAMQAKLLRVIQERQFQRLGGSVLLKSDFRLIAATHRDLAQEIRAGRFREDLYFRIAVFELKVPPLRDRLGDIPLLAARFIEEYRATSRSQAQRISPAALVSMRSYDWPGNVRELQNAVQRALVLCDREEILPEHLPPQVLGNRPASARRHGATASMVLPRPPSSMEDIERQAMEDLILRCHGNVSEAMRSLKMGRNRFYRRLRKYGLMDMLEEVRRSG